MPLRPHLSQIGVTMHQLLGSSGRSYHEPEAAFLNVKVAPRYRHIGTARGMIDRSGRTKSPFPRTAAPVPIGFAFQEFCEGMSLCWRPHSFYRDVILQRVLLCILDATGEDGSRSPSYGLALLDQDARSSTAQRGHGSVGQRRGKSGASASPMTSRANGRRKLASQNFGLANAALCNCLREVWTRHSATLRTGRAVGIDAHEK
jgi:hypothetical protein